MEAGRRRQREQEAKEMRVMVIVKATKESEAGVDARPAATH